MEEVTRELIAAGDVHLTLVEGSGLVTVDDLPDGIHPGDHGHQVLAEAFGGAVAGLAYTGPSLEG
jgi:lysophospholipase L1-like esterase